MKIAGKKEKLPVGIKPQIKAKAEYRPILKTINLNVSHKSLATKVENGKKVSPFGTFKMRSVVILGSTTVLPATLNGKDYVTVNSAKGVRNSSNKVVTKALLKNNDVPTPDAWRFTLGQPNLNEVTTVDQEGNTVNIDTLPFPLIGKPRRGSKGKGLVLVETLEEFKDLSTNFAKYKKALEIDNTTRITDYLFEDYHNYAREYRIHIGPLGVIYTNRKMMKSDTPEEKRWYRNDSNCKWFVETNPKFDKPVNWEEIIEACQTARKAVGLDTCAIDLKVQSATTKKGNKRKNPKFSIIEVNSAPSFGEGTTNAYIKAIPEIIKKKIEEFEQEV